MDDQSSVRLLVVGGSRRETGGISQYIRGQTRELEDRLSVTVHSTSSPPGRTTVDGRPLLGSLWFVIGLGWALAQLGRFLLRRRPHVVHVHASSGFSFYRAGAYVVLASTLWRVPVVVHVHGSDFDTFLANNGPIRSRFVDAVLERADATVVLSEYWSDVVQRETAASNVVVLPNPIDAERYNPRFDGETVRIVYISNLIERKGVSEFVEAIERLNGAAPDYEVVIAGKGPKADQVVELARANDNVSYRGFVSESEKRAILDEGSIYVLPSAAEGLPFSLLEGMAGGNAVVSTTVGSIPEVVDEDHGILVSPIDVDELTDGIQALLEDADRRERMGRANRALVASEYSWSTVADDLVALYRRLVLD